jgi:hypothetical protein
MTTWKVIVVELTNVVAVVWSAYGESYSTILSLVKFVPVRVNCTNSRVLDNQLRLGLIDVSVGFGAVGVTAAEAADEALLPTLLVATTVQVYELPFVSPVTVIAVVMLVADFEVEPVVQVAV